MPASIEWCMQTVVLVDCWKPKNAHPSHAHHNHMPEWSSGAGRASIYTGSTSWAARCHGAQTHSSLGASGTNSSVCRRMGAGTERPHYAGSSVQIAGSGELLTVLDSHGGGGARSGKTDNELQAPPGTEGCHLWNPGLPVTAVQVLDGPIQ